MNIAAWFADGTYEEFDTLSLTSSCALGSPNALTDARLTMDHESGMWLDLSWYDSTSEAWEGADQVAQRRPGCRIRFFLASEVSLMGRCDVNGQTRWLRVGPVLVDMAVLWDMATIVYESEVEHLSLSARTGWLVRHKEGMGGGGHEIPRADPLASLGLTHESLEFVSSFCTSVASEGSYVLEGDSRVEEYAEDFG